MEKNITDIIENGDCMVVFAGEYLGCGKTSVVFDWLWRDLRRDDFLPPVFKSLQSLQVGVTVELNNGERLLSCLSNLDYSVASGGVLQLFPLDRRRNGYQFERVFFQHVKYPVSGCAFSDKVKLCFGCEKPVDGNSWFTYVEENARPESLPEIKCPDLKTLLRTLGILLAEKLDVVFDRTLTIDRFIHDLRGVYSLELLSCKNWNSGVCGVFELKLAARFPPQEKFTAEQKLYDTADFLHEYILEIAENSTMLCQVKELDFSGKQSVAGKLFYESGMLLQLTLI